jgi:ADP-heptose:LPS heptosyltransferase
LFSIDLYKTKWPKKDQKSNTFSKVLKSLSKKIQHIAVMRLSAMGDVAMTVPVLRALVQQNPEVKITVVSRPFFKPFFDTIPNVSFFAFDEKKRHKGFLGLIRLYFDLKPLAIDAFADLHNVLRSKIVRTLFAVNGKKVAFVDKGRAEKKAITRFHDKIFEPLPSMFDRQAIVFQKLGLSVDVSHPSFPPKQQLDSKIKNALGEIPTNSETKLIGIAPFAQYESKVYPLDLMQKVIDALALNPNYKILLFGGGTKEIELLNSLSKNKPDGIVVAGKIQFEQELQLISNLDIMLSMDSGNAHIAAMLGVNVITLWGATHPYLGFSPFNQPLENALVSDRTMYPYLPTSVYGNKKVKGYEDVMRTILPEQVVARIEQILKG